MHPALGVLLVLTALQGIAWSVATAPLNGPDELAHFAYVQHLAETGDGPQRGDVAGGKPQSSELETVLGELGLYAIVGHLEARPSWGNVDALEDRLADAPASARKDGSAGNPAGNYPPLYYAYGAIAYRLSPDTSVLARMTAVRLAGVVLLVVTVLLAWLIAAELFTQVWPRVVVAGLVAFQPKLGFMAGVVNPDIALVTETTALLLVALRTVRFGITWRRVLGLGLLAGAGVMTHGRGLALVPPAALAVLVAYLRFRPPPLAALRAAVPGTAALGALGLFALLYTRSHAAGGGAYGGQTTIGAGFNLRELISYTWQFYFPRLQEMVPRSGPPYGYRQVFIETYFGSFGSLEVLYRPLTYDALQVGAAVGIAAVWSFVLLRWNAVRARWAEVLVVGGTLVAMLALLHVVSYNALRGGGQDPIITGRYLLPCVAVYAGAVGFVCASLPRRAGVVLGGVLLALSALLSVGGIGETLARFYA